MKGHSIVGYKPVDRPKADFYPTPEFATIALIHREWFGQLVWECACGDGAISKVLLQEGYTVISTDLYDYGYGESGIDFLETRTARAPMIITNPPFRFAERFIWHAHVLQIEKMALLLKLTFLEGVERQKLFRIWMPRKIYVFSKRLRMGREGQEYKAGGMIAFAWFIWERGNNSLPVVDWI